MKVGHRDADGEDLSFVVSTWSRSFKASPTAGMIADDDWAGVMHAQIRKLLARPGVRTVVAFDQDDPQFLFGFIAGDPELRVVHYLYVKQPYRRAGHARRLFGALGIDPLLPFRFTCWTYAVPELGSKVPRAAYDPNLARYHD
jgi:hypothetical protein